MYKVTETDHLYEIWMTRDGSTWEFEAGSGTFEGAMQFAEYIEARPSVKRVKVYLGDEVAYDTKQDRGV